MRRQQRNADKVVDSKVLEKEFLRVIGFMFGGNQISRLITNAETTRDQRDQNVIVISDDEDQDECTHNDNSSRRSADKNDSTSSVSYDIFFKIHSQLT